MGTRLPVSQGTGRSARISDSSGQRQRQEGEEVNMSTGQVILLILAIIAIVLLTLLFTGVIG